MSTIFFILFYSFQILVAAATIEAAVLFWTKSKQSNWRGSLASLANFVTRSYFLQWILPVNIGIPAIYWAEQHQLGLIPLKSPLLSFALLFFGQELAYYWFHRCSHRVRWFWLSHAVHHSSNEMNLSAAYRVAVTDGITGRLLFYVPLVWLGFSSDAVFIALDLALFYQFWIHLDWMPKLGPLEYVLNTPSHHRVHHAANLDYLDANYGSTLIIFDRLFGTFVAERADEPCRYGLVKTLASNNPLVIDSHEWVSLIRDLWRARSLRAWVGHLFGPPGWRPDGEGLTTAALRRAALHEPMPDATLSHVAAPAE
jgi:sterol desaturase/sphingolipid hydroxylase (fatty acid hydroxylase superfamily)